MIVFYASYDIYSKKFRVFILAIVIVIIIGLKKRLMYRYLFHSHYTPQVFFFLFHKSTALIRRPVFIMFR